MVNPTFLFISLSLCTLGAMTIASDAIGIECLNAQAEPNKSNKNYLIFSLVMAILCILLACLGLYKSFTSDATIKYIPGNQTN